MEFRVLGQLEVLDDDGAPVDIPGARLRTLLAVLLLHANENVPVDRLVDALWQDSPPEGAANALQKLVSKLRRLLPGRVEWTGTGYRLDAGDAVVDASTFETLVARCRDLSAKDEHTAAARTLADAIALWRGPAFAEFADADFARPEAIRLTELRAGAVEDRVDADLALGGGAELVGELQSLIVEYPLRERLRGQLMLALYRAGRQAEALRAYQEAREMLVEELGIDPSQELRDLEASILAQDAALTVEDQHRVERPHSNLRAPLTSLVGRTQELETITELVQAHRIVTVVGPGGSGKTRLAVEVARRREKDYSHGAWLVELAPLGAPTDVTRTITDALAVPEGASLGASAPIDLLDRLVEFLTPKQLLLILDNCEHVVEETARVVVELVSRCPEVRVIATSREGLAIPGEHLWAVPRLPVQDATALFADRAAASGGFTLTDENRRVVVDICERLDGLPLAIELAAARTRVLPVEEIAGRLDQRFRLLTGGPRTALPRQQTLRAVVDWSYDLLFDDERRVFERLSVFAGGCTLRAAESVVADDEIPAEDIADIVARLVEKSLAIAEHEIGEARFTMLQTLAQYGREHLASAGDAEPVRGRHAAYYGDLADRGALAYRGVNQREWLEEVRRESDNLNAALAWAVDSEDAQLACTIAGGLGWFWWLNGYAAEGFAWLGRALALPGSIEPTTRGRALAWYAWIAAVAGQDVDYITLIDEMMPLLRGGDDRDIHALAAFAMGERLLNRGNAQRANELFEEARVVLEPLDQEPWVLARLSYYKGRLDALFRGGALSEQHYRECLTHAESTGDQFGAALVLSQVAEAALRRGGVADATEALERGRQLARSLALWGSVLSFDVRIATMVLFGGDIDGAAARLPALIDESREIAMPPIRAQALYAMIIVARLRGELGDADAAGEEALAIFRAAHAPSSIALTLSQLGFVAEARGDVAAARALFTDSLAEARRVGDSLAVAHAVEGLAAVAAAEGDPGRAARLLGRAAALRREVDCEAVGPYRADVDRIRAAATEALGEPAYHEAHAAGAEADLESLTS